MNQIKIKIGIAAAAVLLILFAIVIAVFCYRRYYPSQASADLNNYFGLDTISETPDIPQSDPEETPRYAAIIWEQETLTDYYAIFANGTAYLPLTFVSGQLNKRFYFDEENASVRYALPEDILIFSADSISYTSAVSGAETETDAPVFVYDAASGSYYIDIALVKTYTDILYGIFETPDHLWLFSRFDGLELVSAQITKTSGSSDTVPVRLRGGVKSPILTYVSKEETVLVLAQYGKWTQIQTQEGIIGFVRTRFLSEAEPAEIAHPFEEAEYTNIAMEEPVCLLWHQTLGGDTGVSSLPDILERASAINVISPTFFTLSGSDGSISSCGTTEYTETAHAAGVQVWALVENINIEVDTYQILSSTSSRTALIENLIQEAERLNLDGINVDFESLSSETGIHFLQFLRELSVECRSRGLVLSVDNYVPSDYTAFYDRTEQGIVADYIIIMGYDEHWAGGGTTGSTASLPFVQAGIENTLAEVPAEKVINGVPFFTRLWNLTDGTSTACGMNTCIELAAAYGAERAWLEDISQYYLTYEADGSTYEIWLEDLSSAEARLQLMSEYDLAGIACWKAGLDTDEVWDLISQYY